MLVEFYSPPAPGPSPQLLPALLGHLHDILQRVRGQNTAIFKGHNRRIFQVYLNAANHHCQIGPQPLCLCTCLPLLPISNSSPRWITVQRSWGGGVGSHAISSNSTVVTCRGALLDRYCARTGHPSLTPADDAAGAIAFSATMGGSHAALPSASPVAPAPALAGSADVTAVLHNPSSLGSPSLCAPPPGEVGPVTNGSCIVGATDSAAAGCSMAGATGSASSCPCWAWGVSRSPT
jgi:hypothetical protein